jgi:Ca2+-binding RTX toxin-like protein
MLKQGPVGAVGIFEPLPAVDHFTGTPGDDIYYVDDPADTVDEQPGGGQDAIVTSVSYILAPGTEIEGMILADMFSTAALNLTGNAFDQTMYGNAGVNVFNGGGGADAFFGYGGNDIYYVDSQNDYAIEAQGGGRDTIFTSVDYRLQEGSHIEALSASDAAATTDLVLIGDAAANSIFGNDGDNTLIGGAGGDLLIGYGGDDIYYVDERFSFGIRGAPAQGDAVAEALGGGYDTVFTTVSYSIWTNPGNQAHARIYVEALAVADRLSTTAVNLEGSDSANTLFGNEGSNILNGQRGADVMIGYGGDDTYYVTNRNDFAVEEAGGGIDTVLVGFDYILAENSNIENIGIADGGYFEPGLRPNILMGNSQNNVIDGSRGANVLIGGGGTDTLIGGTTRDTYYVDDMSDIVIDAPNGGFSRDTVFASSSYTLSAGSEIEALSAISQAGTDAFDLTGNEFGNQIYGNAGDNVLDGRGGLDILMGYGGSDTFQFSTAIAPSNIDNVYNFDADDVIALDAGIFTGLPLGALSPNAFVTGAAAADADDRIIYNSQTGALLFDVDGVGGADAVQFAFIDTPLTPLSAADFVIV